MTSFCGQGGRGVKKVPKYACILIQSSQRKLGDTGLLQYLVYEWPSHHNSLFRFHVKKPPRIEATSWFIPQSAEKKSFSLKNLRNTGSLMVWASSGLRINSPSKIFISCHCHGFANHSYHYMNFSLFKPFVLINPRQIIGTDQFCFKKTSCIEASS